MEDQRDVLRRAAAKNVEGISRSRKINMIHHKKAGQKGADEDVLMNTAKNVEGISGNRKINMINHHQRGKKDADEDVLIRTAKNVEGISGNRKIHMIHHQKGEKDADEDRRRRSSGSRMVKRLVMEDVDKVGDDFIKKFRNQLKFEREQSFKRFQEMIHRGL